LHVCVSERREKERREEKKREAKRRERGKRITYEPEPDQVIAHERQMVPKSS
jgi:hypothetical protein